MSSKISNTTTPRLGEDLAAGFSRCFWQEYHGSNQKFDQISHKGKPSPVSIHQIKAMTEEAGEIGGSCGRASGGAGE
eukprot:TRINITY_DN2731_c0_g1_i1.p1 TRINITY_DN2731_c0_g1~~TRINITY_DN2731_c0_g1_i1.p1  ORF type:complete len:77 (+),score=18.87 TRINITY_DN2731_c0_g1_i1:600-830(+)